jgi:hypothetical protein
LMDQDAYALELPSVLNKSFKCVGAKQVAVGVFDSVGKTYGVGASVQTLEGANVEVGASMSGATMGRKNPSLEATHNNNVLPNDSFLKDRVQLLSLNGMFEMLVDRYEMIRMIASGRTDAGKEMPDRYKQRVEFAFSKESSRQVGVSVPQAATVKAQSDRASELTLTIEVDVTFWAIHETTWFSDERAKFIILYGEKFDEVRKLLDEIASKSHLIPKPIPIWSWLYGDDRVKRDRGGELFKIFFWGPPFGGKT